MNMTDFIAPKSQQINADDLIAGPLTIKVERVTGTGNADQPVAIYFDGDGGKPFLPCKSMRRVLVAAWGADASQYAGRSMTIYRDPKVAFGGMEVGGIRISHMSHIEREMVMALTVTKAKRTPYTVKPLAQQQPTASGKADLAAQALIERIRSCHDADALAEVLAEAKVVEQRAWMASKRPDLAALVDAAEAEARATVEG